jgi:hypothetical protein
MATTAAGWFRTAVLGFLLLAAGCAANRDRIPATSAGPVGDPFFTATRTRPGTTSPASAAGDTQRLPAQSGLGSTPAPATPTSGGNEQSAVAPPRPPAATLLSPDSLGPTPAQLAHQPAVPAGIPPVQAVGWNSTQPNLDMMLERLQQRGVTRMRLDLVDGQWLFSCDVPNPANPNTKKHFENADSTRAGAVRPIYEEVERLTRR